MPLGNFGDGVRFASKTLDNNAYLCYNVYMEEKKTSPVLRAREGTRKKLKIIAALTGESMLDVLDRLVKAELERIQKERRENDQSI